MTSKSKKLLIILIIFLLLTAIGFWNQIFRGVPPAAEHVVFGATFSKKYAEDLRLSWKDVLIQSLDDLKINYFRIPVYWDDIEKKEGVFNFSDIDWMLDEIGKRDGEVVLAIGRKLPRWPECHEPSWTEDLSRKEVEGKILVMLEKVVNHFKDNKIIVKWQVENEPLFLFGECPFPTMPFLKEETELVKSLDSTRDIIVTDSGELSTWLRTSTVADILGISMYRVSYNKYFGYWYYPLKPTFYSDKAKFIKTLVADVMITELQAEPWVNSPIRETDLGTQYLSMNEFFLEGNFNFAARTGFDKALLWGIEWWYWLREQGEPQMWDTGKMLIEKYK